MGKMCNCFVCGCPIEISQMKVFAMRVLLTGGCIHGAQVP